MHPYYGSSNLFFEEGNYWWLGLASMAMYLLFWTIVIVIAIRLFKKLYERTDHPRASEDNAMMILRERYAKGEIDADEFRQKKADLE